MSVIKEFYYGDTCILTAKSDNCCEFSHWTKGENCGVYSKESTIEVLVEEASSFNAVFIKKKVKINVVLNYPNLGRTVGSGFYDCGETVEIAAYTYPCNNIEWRNVQNGNAILGSCPNNEIGITATIIAEDDITYYADITQNSINASVVCCPDDGGHAVVMQNGSGVLSENFGNYFCDSGLNTYTNNGNFQCGSQVTFFEQPNNGYVFKGWYIIPCGFNVDCDLKDFENSFVNINENSQYYTTTLCEEICMLAKFERYYTITILVDGCDNAKFSYTIDGVEYEYNGTFNADEGKILTLTLFDYDTECCVFSNWTFDTVIENNQSFSITAEKNMIIICHFMSSCLEIAVDMQGCVYDNSVVYYKKIGQSNFQRYETPIYSAVENEIALSCVYDENCCVFDKWIIRNGNNTIFSNDNPMSFTPMTVSNFYVTALIERKNITLQLYIPSNISYVIGYNGRYYTNTTNGEIISYFQMGACEDVIIWFSSEVDELDYSSIEPCYIKGKVYVNGFETKIYHGIIDNELYFRKENDNIVANNGSIVNAVVAHLHPNTSITIVYDDSINTMVSSNFQTYYFYDNQQCPCAYGEKTDFNCPFVDTNQTVADLILF